MSFTHALYYPWIDIENIENRSWFKTAVLYWDKISTIVPEGYSYQSTDAKFLRDAGVLFPEFVSPFEGAVREASRNFLAYYSTHEASGILLPEGTKVFRIPDIDEAKELASLNVLKMDDDLRRELIKSKKVKEDGEWLIFDLDAVNYYMTLLASSISRRKHLALLTEDDSFELLSSRVRRGDEPSLHRGNIGEGLLARVTLESVGIPEETSYDDLVKLREDLRDELGYFRTEIGKLAQEIDSETPTEEALQQQVHDIFTNKIAPAVNTLRKSLQRKRIRNIVSHLASFIFAGSINYFIPENTMANLLTYAGGQVLANTVNFALDQRDQLAQNPYSFVLKVEEQLA